MDVDASSSFWNEPPTPNMNMFVCSDVNSPEVIWSIHHWKIFSKSLKRTAKERKNEMEEMCWDWRDRCCLAFALVVQRTERVFDAVAVVAAAGLILIDITLINNCWNNACLIMISQRINSLLSRRDISSSLCCSPIQYVYSLFRFTCDFRSPSAHVFLRPPAPQCTSSILLLSQLASIVRFMLYLHVVCAFGIGSWIMKYTFLWNKYTAK